MLHRPWLKSGADGQQAQEPAKTRLSCVREEGRPEQGGQGKPGPLPVVVPEAAAPPSQHSPAPPPPAQDAPRGPRASFCSRTGLCSLVGSSPWLSRGRRSCRVPIAQRKVKPSRGLGGRLEATQVAVMPQAGGPPSRPGLCLSQSCRLSPPVSAPGPGATCAAWVAWGSASGSGSSRAASRGGAGSGGPGPRR